MENKWDDYNQRVELLKSLLPNFEFADTLVDNDGNPVDAWIFFSHVTALIKNAKLNGVHVSPHVILSLNPVLKASAMPKGKECLTINLGIPLVANSMPNLISLLDNKLDEIDNLAIIEIDKISSINIEEKIIKEIHEWIVFCCDSLKEKSNLHFPSFHNKSVYHFTSSIESIVVFHEFGHLLEKYSPEIYQDRLGFIEDLLVEWLDANKERVKKHYDLNDDFLLDSNVIKCWSRELDADHIGYGTLFNDPVREWAGYRKKDIIDCQAAMALFFFILELLEFSWYTAKGKLELKRHPPAAVRKELFVYTLQRLKNVKDYEFLQKYWGAGFVIDIILSRIFQESINRYLDNPC